MNNATVFPAFLATEISEPVSDETVNTNLKGGFFASQFAVNAMIAAGRGGRIINILSVDAFRPSGMLVAYAAAKAGLWAVTPSMAKSWPITLS